MAWQVAILLDADSAALVREMPVWALETAERVAMAKEVRESVAGFWYPEPAFTLFSDRRADALARLENILETVIEHHPRLVSLHLLGIEPSEVLSSLMADCRFESVGKSEYGLLFRRPIIEVPALPQLVLDASQWTTRDDIYKSFFAAVGAPDWHGKNLDALNDSIVTGGINRIEVPYKLTIFNWSRVGASAAQDANVFTEFLEEIAARGCPLLLEVVG